MGGRASIRRRALFALATSAGFETATRRLPIGERAARKRALRYVAGEQMADALALAARLEREGVGSAIDFFGEQVGDSAAASAATDGYVALAEALTLAGSKATVAIDLSHVGLEMLLGVRNEDVPDLVERGIPVRLYVPYGQDWFRYWMRRIAESQGA